MGISPRSGRRGCGAVFCLRRLNCGGVSSNDRFGPGRGRRIDAPQLQFRLRMRELGSVEELRLDRLWHSGRTRFPRLLHSSALLQPATLRRRHRRTAVRSSLGLDCHARAARSELDWVRPILVPSVQQEAHWSRLEKSATVASPPAEDSGETVRSVSRVAPPRNLAASALFRSGAGWSAWVACAHFWTLWKSEASARGQAGALRLAPAAAHRCPSENALLASVRPVVLLASVRPVVLLAGRPSSALERQVSSRPQPPSPVLPVQRGTLHAQSRPCRRLLPVP